MAPPKTSQLLETLIHAATAIVEERGRREVTLRSVAERVTADVRRISHTAAFAHVSGQLELLTHVAAGGWARLLVDLEDAATIPAPTDRLVELGVRYRHFAAAHPNLFRVMYDEEMWARIGETALPQTEGVSPPAARRSTFKQPQVLRQVRAHRDQAFGVFALAVDQGIREGVLRDTSVGLMARSIAALAHGLAMEALDERLPEGEVRPILQIAVDGMTVR